MNTRGNLPFWPWFCFVLLVTLPTALAGEDDDRCRFWIDMYRGEPIPYEAMLDDLAGVRVIYIGESHSLKRHHEIQAQIIGDLAGRGVSLVLGLEQLESFQQAALDRYNQGRIDFDQLAEATQWSERWNGYEQYRPIVEAAHEAGAPILALNARSETIRQIARSGGLAKIDPETRKQLPADIQLEDPLYEKLLNIYMMVHAAATPKRLRPMVDAQIARDEMMASVVSSFLTSERGKGRTAIVICGSGHVSYALGTAARVRRRMPGVKDRIILLSDSGDVKLSPRMKAVSRKITVTHEHLRAIQRPIADYLHAVSLRPKP